MKTSFLPAWSQMVGYPTDLLEDGIAKIKLPILLNIY
jgi:hypothetical protein